MPGGGRDWQLAQLELATPVDSLEFKRAFHESAYLLAQHGESCSGAQDKDACQARRASLEESFLQQYPSNCAEACPSLTYVLTTSGDEVKLWSTQEELKELLGSIEGPAEAGSWFVSQGHVISCGDAAQSGFRETEEGLEFRTRVNTQCDPYEESLIVLLVRPDGTIEEKSREVVYSGPESCAVIGRRPHGLTSAPSSRAQNVLAHYWGTAAHLEAASVPAFEILADELQALGAPRALIEKALEARLDEVAHAEAVGALATRFGAELTQVVVEKLPRRHLFALALDNAVEGCVRETFGALLGTFQAEHAQDPETRALMERIAEDETRHAGLAWQIAQWLLPQLSANERAQIRSAQRDAIAAIARELSEPQPEPLFTFAGMPSPEQGRALVQTLEQTLWQDALAA